MKILILSCSTGGGHNACGRYIEKEFAEYNINCHFVDYFDILGPNAKKHSEKIYLNTTKGNGSLFKIAYKLGEAYSKTGITSPVYGLNKLAKNKLYSYIQKYNYDLIISPHLFPAMAITTLKNDGKDIKLINVATDYHAVPFWEETKPDYFVIPHSSLKREFIEKGFKEEILLDLGISVSSSFSKVKNNLNLPTNKDIVLITSGSMGFGKMKDIVNSPEDYKRFYHNVNGKKIRHDKVHNLFGYNMTRAAGEAFERIDPEKRFLMFSRSSYIGMHRYGGIWMGDNKSWWSHILLNLKMLPSLNMCGFMYTGADLGGFGDDTTRDLLLRFLALGVFTPLMRDHAAEGTREQECYQFENIEDFRSVINARYRLVPYLYSEYMKAALNDDMYFKPLGFVYPDDKMAIRVEDQLMLGNEIMIAPVYEQNARGRYVYLPEEMKFIKFMPDGSISEEVLEKGVHYVDVALNEVPLFIRSGKCIPVAEAAECVKDIDTENLQLIGYEGSSYTLYEDDGIHKDYDKKENYRVLTK